MLKVTTKDAGGVTHFYVHNIEAADVTTTFDVQLTNLKSSVGLPYSLTVPGNATVEVFTLTPIEKGVPWKYDYTDSFTMGSLSAVHDDKYVYDLPYDRGSVFRVSQGYHGPFSHTGPDEYSIDWKMPLGTPVRAARSGVVVKSRDDSDTGGPDRKFENCANCVLIQHLDGTIGIYAHLSKGGNKVKVGDKVNVGDLIGLSGNTGFTSGPHLHFSVFKAKNGRERESIPVKFKTADDPAITLMAGQSYKSAPNEVQNAKAPVRMIGTISPRKKS
jgi:murein DD-endopeptidase MepM/ murein hydrolase activator NlpD